LLLVLLHDSLADIIKYAQRESENETGVRFDRGEENGAARLSI
jgi:hypothetical protein